MDELAGRTAVVTGAASGIGLALATSLTEQGMQVVLADRDAAAVGQAADVLAAAGAAVRAVATDVADPASVDALAAAATEAFGPVHLLANNAGILRPGSTFEQPLDDWHAVFGVNVLGIVHGLQSFVPAMLAHGEPCHVLNTASVGGLIASPHMAAYIASKHAAVAISECLALEVAGTAMGVTVLCPGGVATAIYRAEAERRATVGLSASGATEAVFDKMAAPDRDDQATPEEIAAVAVAAIHAGRLHAMSFGTDQVDTVRRRHLQIERAMAATADG
jgi:NAD(P)-dependent dehydrogenase (short-subunit alcohol dehydrogenase family)